MYMNEEFMKIMLYKIWIVYGVLIFVFGSMVLILI